MTKLKGTPCALLVGMQTGTSAIENSMKVPQKLKIDLPCNLAILLLGIFPTKTQTLVSKAIYIYPHIHYSIIYESRDIVAT